MVTSCPYWSFLDHSLFLCKDRALERDRPHQRCSTRHARSFEVSQTSISASYEVSQAQKAILLMPRTAKGASTSSEGWMHRCHRSQMKNTIFQLMKTVSKSTWMPGCLPILATLQVNRFGHRTLPAAALLLNARNYPRVWWSEKHYWADSERTLRAVSALHRFSL